MVAEAREIFRDFDNRRPDLAGQKMASMDQRFAQLNTQKGYKVLTAFDGVQAMMQAMRMPSVDAIVLDINMPGGSGEETLKKLKMSTRTALIPVVILSGSIDEKGQERVRALGADTVLSKPLVPEELFKALEAAL
jgi:DNA-binding response OmpR family regulator